MFPARLTQPEIDVIVHAACDAGITSFDTAPLYGFHRGEEQLGRALRDRRQQVQILSKAGLRWDKENTPRAHGRELFSFTDARGRTKVVRRNSRPESLREEAHGSLKRLGVDVVDVLQLHQPDDDTPIAHSIEALSELQRAGLIRSYGLSNFSAAQLEAACVAAGSGGVVSLQSEYNLIERSPERELLPACLRRGVGFLAYSPLAKGVLAGGSRLRSAGVERASAGSHYDDRLTRLALRPLLQGALVEIAQARNVSTAQLSLAWLLAQPGVSAVVVGASNVAQVQELARAATLRLSQRDVDQLSKTFARAGSWVRLAGRARSAPVVGRVLGRLLGLG
jgi:aryl-alcohol dehydrogenase-like predicted oxidoreductase